MKKHAAYPVFLFYSFSVAMFFSLAWTVNMLYFVTVAKMDPLQLVLVGTALEGATFIFEIPTGIVADVYSRRLSIIIGMFLTGVGYLITGTFPAFLPIVLGQIIWGLGYTFTSGAQQAWITDEIGEENASRAFLRGAQFELLGAFFGTIISVVLATVTIQLPILICGGMFFVLGVYLLLFMPENGFKSIPPGERNTWQHFGHTFQESMAMVRRRPVLLSILGIGLFYGLYSEGYDRLWTASLLQRFSFPTIFHLPDVTWFGILGVVSLLVSAGLNGVVLRALRNPRPADLVRAMLAASLLLVAALAGFALSSSFLVAILLIWVIAALRNVVNPLYTSWVNYRLDPQVRATVLSMSSQVDALGQIGGGPVVGLVAKQISIRVGLLASTAILSPVLALLARQLRPSREEIPPQSQD